MLRRFSILFALVLGLTVGGLGQDEIELVLEDGVNDYAGTKDTTIYSEADNANGAGQHVFVGFTARGNERRTLLAFDLSGLPQDAQITSVALTLTVNKTKPGSIGLALHRLTTDWGEGDVDSPGQEGAGASATADSATWTSNFHENTEWETAGGDFVAEASAETVGKGVDSSAVFEGDGLVLDVQAWLKGETDNFGWILIGDNESTAKRFHASDGSADEGQKPRLTIRYTIAP